MKTLTNIMESVTPLYESILTDTKTRVTDVKKDIIRSSRELVIEYINKNYIGYVTVSKVPNKDGFYEVESSDKLTIKPECKEIAPGFVFKYISHFVIRGNKNIKTLHGIPKSCRYLELEDLNLTNLDGLNTCTNERGFSLWITRCHKLKNMMGADKALLDGLYIKECNGIVDLTGLWSDYKLTDPFRNMTQCNLSVVDCPKFKSLEGAGRLEDIRIRNCPMFVSLRGVDNRWKSWNLDIRNCPKLKSLDGCPSVRRVYIDGCKSLSDVKGMNLYDAQYATVELWNCPKLKSLEGVPSVHDLFLSKEDWTEEEVRKTYKEFCPNIYIR